MIGPIKALIVDDTVIYRKILSSAMECIDGVEVVGTAPSGSLAIQKVKLLKPNLILLDIFMDGMDGVETLEAIKKEHPDINVVMISGNTSRDAVCTMKALSLGALEFIPKPKAKSPAEGIEFLRNELTKIVNIIEPSKNKTKKTPALNRKPIVKRQKSAPSSIPQAVELIAIGVSTGGPNALNAIIPKLTTAIRKPILIVQHMPAEFTASLAAHLDKQSILTVKEACNKEIIAPNTVYIAPGNFHMELLSTPGVTTRHKIKLTQDPPVNSCRPAVDVLYDSLANIKGGPILSVILTGMGEDGTRGLHSLKGKTYCLAQDKPSCTVYGMSRTVIENGLEDEIIPLNKIPERITQLCQTGLRVTQ